MKDRMRSRVGRGLPDCIDFGIQDGQLVNAGEEPPP